MKNQKLKQLESEIHYKISEIVNEIDNEIVKESTITEVILNNDYSIAKIYVSFINYNQEFAFNEFKKFTSFIRKELAHSLNIKKVPFLEFILDDHLNKINEMEEIIKKIKK